ncbi:hypothetical protein SAMN02746065_12915 [Desulfocicer vacuolatum DSM 3385]|uniref:Uncharacterized protein n=1 Tax=Desulfocicer vacuolatum DSM 3385 TaxID=1121400 RepID=A0A1W2ED33_9BACT|nr:hypothetical protein SAMN02746065_12915 [Desulfocicer vacuolatum DSM 3385]
MIPGLKNQGVHCHKFYDSTFGVRISWWGQAFVIDIIEAFFVGKGLGR